MVARDANEAKRNERILTARKQRKEGLEEGDLDSGRLTLAASTYTSISPESPRGPERPTPSQGPPKVRLTLDDGER